MYKWYHPYLVYCKGNSEIIFRNVHYNERRVTLPLSDFFIGFVDMEQEVLKRSGILDDWDAESDYDSNPPSENDDSDDFSEEGSEESFEGVPKRDSAVGGGLNESTKDARKSRKGLRQLTKVKMLDEDSEEKQENFEDLRIQEHAVHICFLSLNKSGYQLNVVKLFPYQPFQSQQPLWYKSKLQWKNSWIPQDQAVEAFLIRAQHCGKSKLEAGTVLVSQFGTSIEMVSLVNSFKHVSKLKNPQGHVAPRMLLQQKDLCANLDSKAEKLAESTFQVIYVKHDKEIGGSKLKVLDLHQGLKDPQYNLETFPGQFIEKLCLYNRTHLLWMNHNLNFYSAELKVNGKKTVLG